MKDSRNDDERRHFIVKHGLDSLEALPAYIWRTGLGSDRQPRGFAMVRPGDKWISYAYTSSDGRERSLSLVTGFYECIEPSSYENIPLLASERKRLFKESGRTPKKAWLITGRPDGKALTSPVGVASIDELLGRPTYSQQTLVRISKEKYEEIRQVVSENQLDLSRIQLLGREPQCEQELLAIVVSAHKQLGIYEIVRVRKSFPDLLVRMSKDSEPVHLDLETYSKSFMAHGHDRQVKARKYEGDKVSVAVLCWLDNDRQHRKVEKYVHKVYELRTLIRNGRKIVW